MGEIQFSCHKEDDKLKDGAAIVVYPKYFDKHLDNDLSGANILHVMRRGCGEATSRGLVTSNPPLIRLLRARP